jgi:hypothetical protein
VGHGHILLPTCHEDGSSGGKAEQAGAYMAAASWRERPCPVVSVSYSAGHVRLAGERGVCPRFGGNEISVLAVGGYVRVPLFWLLPAQFPAAAAAATVYTPLQSSAS